MSPLLIYPVFLLLAIGLLFAVVGLATWLWNTTLPEVFGLKKINFWQMFRLLILANILFGGLGLRFNG